MLSIESLKVTAQVCPNTLSCSEMNCRQVLKHYHEQLEIEALGYLNLKRGFCAFEFLAKKNSKGKKTRTTTRSVAHFLSANPASAMESTKPWPMRDKHAPYLPNSRDLQAYTLNCLNSEPQKLHLHIPKP